jgi:hypothetical protein
VSSWDGCWTVDGGDIVSDSKLISSKFEISQKTNQRSQLRVSEEW